MRVGSAILFWANRKIAPQLFLTGLLFAQHAHGIGARGPCGRQDR